MSRRARSANPWVTTTVAILAVCAIFAGGWTAAQIFVSPAQRDAIAEAPSPRPVTAQVERGRLSTTVSSEVTVDQNRQDVIDLSIGPGVVTNVLAASGSIIGAGSVVAEVNGRPLFAAPGDFRFFRDLVPGDSGPDVAQLQRTLIDAGYDVDETADFDEATEHAARQLYEDSEYDIPEREADDTSVASTPAPTAAAVEPSPILNPSAEIMVPQSEFIVVPVLPAAVETAPIVGDVAEDSPRVTLRSGAITAQATIPNDVAAQIHVGQSATLTVEGRPIGVHVSSVIASDDGSATALSFEPVDSASPLPAEWLRRTGTVMIDLELIAEDALLVPSSSISNHGDHASVQVVHEDGIVEISIREIGALDGRSAIEPVVPDAISVGAHVEVGGD